MFELDYNQGNQKIDYFITVMSAKGGEIIQSQLAVCDFMNIEFLHHYDIPPFCISSNLRDVHIQFIRLGYLSAFYPIFLIFLTWICIELHDHNFRLFALLWRPFHIRVAFGYERGLESK